MRVLNKKYWHAMVRIPYDYRKEDAIYIWCRENFGKGGFCIIGPDSYYFKTYYFKTQEDATLFSLRWL